MGIKKGVSLFSDLLLPSKHTQPLHKVITCTYSLHQTSHSRFIHTWKIIALHKQHSRTQAKLLRPADTLYQVAATMPDSTPIIEIHVYPTDAIFRADRVENSRSTYADEELPIHD